MRKLTVADRVHDLMLSRGQARARALNHDGPCRLEHLRRCQQSPLTHRTEQLAVDLDRGRKIRVHQGVWMVLEWPREGLDHARIGDVARLMQETDDVCQPVARNQDVEVAHEPSADIGVEAIDEADRAFKQHRLDADAVEECDQLRELAAELAVALGIRRVYCCQERTNLAVERFGETKVFERRSQGGENEVLAGLSNDALPVDGSVAECGPQLDSGLAPAQPLGQNAGNDVVGVTQVEPVHASLKSDPTCFMAWSRSP